MCDGWPECESEDNIRKWISGKYIVLLYNEVTFNTERYFDESKNFHSRLMYIPISSQLREIIPLKITTTELELQDNAMIMLDAVSMIRLNDLFKVNRMEKMPYEESDRVLVTVTVEMDLTVNMYERQVYTIFQMLSDFGGLTTILGYLFFKLQGSWNYQSFDNFMVSRLFKVMKPRDEIQEEKSYFRKSEFFKLSSTPNFRNIFGCIPLRCCKAGQSRKERAMQMARDKLN